MKKLLLILLLLSSVSVYGQEKDPTVRDLKKQIERLGYESERSIEDFDKEIEINPEYATAYYNKGLALLQVKQTL